MKFDIARKVVKFRNGQFGIRRWGFFEYQYLDLSGDCYWWTIKEYVAKYAAGTEEQVRERIALYLVPKVRMDTSNVPGFDKGRPV
jgi:hypothetical protein